MSAGLAVPTAEQGDLLALIAEDHQQWAHLAEPYIRQLAATGEPFEAFDLIRAGCPDSLAPNAIGPVLQNAARRGLIRQWGYGKSSRPSTRGSAVRLWTGCNST